MTPESPKRLSEELGLDLPTDIPVESGWSVEDQERSLERLLKQHGREWIMRHKKLLEDQAAYLASM
jgi:hypothetical protein